MDFDFDIAKPKHIEDLNVVPILDMFVSVIFFILLSTSFIGYTKLQVPPSSVSTITNPVLPPPLAAKLTTTQTSRGYQLLLSWRGANPDQRMAYVTKQEIEQNEKAVQEKTEQIVSEFSAKYPNEKTLQIGMGANVPYQILINVMDGILKLTPDVVLISYQEATALNAREDKGG